MKTNTAIISVIILFSLIGNLIGGYLLFFVVGGQNDLVTITLKASFMAVVTALYAWFMWSHRTSRGVSYRISR